MPSSAGNFCLETRICNFRMRAEKVVMKNSSAVLFTFPLLGIYLLGGVITIPAQQTGQSTVTINTDLVVTWARVTNPKTGSAIKSLGASDFQLREENKLQQISLVKEGRPLSVVLLVEGYAHTWPAERWYRRIPEMLRELGENAEISVMGYDSTTVLVQPLTKNLHALTDKLKDKAAFHYFLGRHLPERIAEAPPGEIALPRIGGAIYEAVNYLGKTAVAERRKIIIFITEPSFWQSQIHLRTRTEVEQLLEQTGTTVYALLHGNEVRVHEGDLLHAFFHRASIKRRESGGTLGHFVDFTGGLALKGSWEGCDELFIKLAKQIRSSYTIGYYPENINFDGRFRRIKVELSRGGKTKVGKADIKTRDGYHALRRSAANPTDKVK